MNKKMRELLAKHDLKVKEAKAFMEGETKDVEAFNKAMDEADAIMAEYEAEKRIYEAEKKAVQIPEDVTTKEGEDPAEKGAKEPETPVDSTKAFADACRAGFPKSMSEGTPADGGYTVPEDIQTRINEYRESKFSLLSLVDVEPVTTNKGSRTFKKRSQQTGFSKVGEGGKIGAKATPQFARLDYEIAKYGGYFPVTNELLEDSDSNIANTLVTWIGDESRVTANVLIIEQINTKAKTDLKNLDGIKKALNVTLGSAFKGTSKIVTNDDGLQYLDTLKDKDDDYILSTSPADPMKMVLCAGATVVPVEVIPNADLPSDTETVPGSARIPFVIGDLKEGIKYFDRKQTTIKISDVAVVGDLNAFEEDLTLYRAIEREDVKVKDEKAFVNGYIEVAGE